MTHANVRIVYTANAMIYNDKTAVYGLYQLLIESRVTRKKPNAINILQAFTW